MFVKESASLYNIFMRNYQSDINRIMSLIYEDQPIAPSARAPLVEIPARIKAIRSMGKGVAAYRQPRELIFVHQAKMLEDYEDDFEYGREVNAWYPTYETLTDEQLRGYFGFRTRVRKGNVRKESRCFAYLYIYELLNLIGCQDPKDAFFKLSGFLNTYGALDPGILPYAEQWLIDFILYYEMNPILIMDRKPIMLDNALAVLLKAEESFRGNARLEATASEIFQSVFTLSGMKTSQLPSLLKDPECFAAVVAKTFQGMCEHYFLHRKTTLLEDYAGGEKNELAFLFSGAVFHDRSPVKGSGTFSGNKRSFDVSVSSVTTYHCEYGKWGVKTWRRNFHNPHFSELLKAIDSVIREEEQEPGIVSYGVQTKWIRKLIAGSFLEYKKEKEEEEARRVEIDLSALAGIRSAAAQTMEKLMTEEERYEAPEETSEIVQEETRPDAEVVYPLQEAEEDRSGEEPMISEDAGPQGNEKEETKNDPAGLSEMEKEVLRWALAPERFSKPETGNLIMSVIVDSINEKLYDFFADLVLENDAVPTVIEDYREELEEMYL